MLLANSIPYIQELEPQKKKERILVSVSNDLGRYTYIKACEEI